MLEYPPLSLYVHIPWCIRKCPYCDFNSHQQRDSLPEADYVAALCTDLRAENQSRDGSDRRRLSTIFIGGGTPSLFSAAAIAEILAAAEKEMGFEDDIEITLEANPGAAEAERFRDYRSAGVNRLSLGIQSFQDEQLLTLGRVHDSQQAEAAIRACIEAGFDNFNLDLMHGLPGQTQHEAMADLEHGIAFEPAHLSWYQLTIEPNTAFHNRPPLLPDESTISSMQDAGLQSLSAAGFGQYEVSAYAKQGRKSRHNLNYWQFGDYLGVGAGAHGKLTLPASERIIRSRKRKQPLAYMTADINRTAELLDVAVDQRPFEFLMNSLRLRSGFTESTFENRTGVTFSRIAKQVEYLSSQDLLTRADGSITTTERGFRVLNSLLEEFLYDDDR